MPVSPTYPGVYIQEVDSGSRVVTGVATSITGFVGRTSRGPTDLPVTVYDFGEFQNLFGGRAKDMPMTYAVEDFFGNGGTQAIIARVVSANSKAAALGAGAAAPAAGGAAAPAAGGPLNVTASSAGAWGNTVQVAFQAVADHAIDDMIQNRYPNMNLDKTKFVMVYAGFAVPGKKLPAVSEAIGPVYIDADDIPIRIDYVLAASSMYLRCDPPSKGATAPAKIDPAGTPAPQWTWTAMAGGTDGDPLKSTDLIGDQNSRTGMYLLEHTDIFNILVIPRDQGTGTTDDDQKVIATAAAEYCSARTAVYITEPLNSWSDNAKTSQYASILPTDLPIGELDQKRRTFAYFPMVKKLDPESGNREGLFSASGMIAGIFASTDVRRGVWKAPAGIEAGMSGVVGLDHRLTDMQNGVLNQVGINVLRDFPVIGPVIWGSRTLAGADALSDDYKYLPVRRLTDYIELSLFRGTKFAVFEPNSETLWSQLRLTCDAFMSDLNRQGAFYRYYVQCDKSTTTQLDIDKGIVNVIIAFAPVKPAEFVILTIQQLAGQTAA